MHAFRARQFSAKEVEPFALTHLEGKVLGILAKTPHVRQSELITMLGRDKGQVARLVAGLRSRGLMTTTADDADRRAVRLTVSELGRSALAALTSQEERVANLACDGLSAAEMRDLVDALERMKERLTL